MLKIFGVFDELLLEVLEIFRNIRNYGVLEKKKESKFWKRSVCLK